VLKEASTNTDNLESPTRKKKNATQALKIKSERSGSGRAHPKHLKGKDYFIREKPGPLSIPDHDPRTNLGWPRLSGGSVSYRRVQEQRAHLILMCRLN
jgi:hypothetical protein